MIDRDKIAESVHEVMEGAYGRRLLGTPKTKFYGPSERDTGTDKPTRGGFGADLLKTPSKTGSIWDPHKHRRDRRGRFAYSVGRVLRAASTGDLLGNGARNEVLARLEKK